MPLRSIRRLVQSPVTHVVLCQSRRPLIQENRHWGIFIEVTGEHGGLFCCESSDKVSRYLLPSLPYCFDLKLSSGLKTLVSNFPSKYTKSYHVHQLDASHFTE